MDTEPLTDTEQERAQQIKEVTDRLGVWRNWDRLNESPPPIPCKWDVMDSEIPGIQSEMVDLRANILFRGTNLPLQYWHLDLVYDAWMQCFGPRYHHPSFVLIVNFRHWLGVTSNGKGWRTV